MNKFEQLVEMVDRGASLEERTALFHEITVDLSRKIYESLLADEGEVDDLMGDETHGDDFDVEADPTDDMVDAAPDAGDFEADDSTEADLEDRVVDLESQIEELVAEFEQLMNQEDGESAEGEEDGESAEDDLAADSEDLAPEDDEDLDADMQALAEAVELFKVGEVKGGDNGANAKSVVAANSGKKPTSSSASPVKVDTTAEAGRGKVAHTEFAGKWNAKAELTKAAAPATAKDAGNTRSVLEGKKRK
jgi:hypothetical protein